MEVLEGGPEQDLGLAVSNPGILNERGYQMPLVKNWPRGSVAFLSGEPSVSLRAANPEFRQGPIFRYQNVVQPIQFSRGQYPDMLTEHDQLYVIYWADDHGMYDSTRRSYLNSPRKTKLGTAPIVDNLYVGRFREGEFDDILVVIRGKTEFGPNGERHGDSIWALRYQGGRSDRDTTGGVFEDSALYMQLGLGGNDAEDCIRVTLNGDYNGDRITDFLGGRGADLFFIDSRKGIDLHTYAYGLLYDTLLSRSAEGIPPVVSEGLLWNITHGKILPKEPGDLSEDWMCLPNSADFKYGQYDGKSLIFRGGPDFGKKRLHLSDAEVIIPRYPGMYGPDEPSLVGDMTGTGVPVLHMGAGTLYKSYHLFYSMGVAADNKVDCFYDAGDHFRPTTRADSLTCNSDRFGDVLLGDSWRNSGVASDGKLSLLKGTSRIPAKPNPKYGVRSERSSRPSLQYDATARAILLSEGDARGTLSIYDLLGRVVMTKEFDRTDGPIRYSLPLLSSGTYLATFDAGGTLETLRITIIR